MKEEIKGKVVAKFIDYENHNYPVIYVNVGLEEQFYYNAVHDLSGLFDYIEIGDSLSKPINSTHVRVLRGHNLRTFAVSYGIDCYQSSSLGQVFLSR